ncbi:MAG: geranylgeranylglycerol-phosphate geranylgeranyltransferase [Candidatus Bathyarchaeia archaeon]
MNKFMSSGKKFLGFLRLIRPVNSLMMGLAVIVGVFLTRGQRTNVVSFTLGFLTAFTFTGASMALNDFYDREIDVINVPHRPIPSGAVSPRGAILTSALLTLIGFFSAFLTNFNCFLLATIAWALFTMYSTKGKKMGLIGNMMVSTCVSIPFIYGGFISHGSFDAVTLIFSGIAFLANTGREVTKGIADLEGDKLSGVNTVAVTHGPLVAAILSTTFYLGAVFLSLIPYSRKLLSLWCLPTLVLADAGFVYSSASLLLDRSRGSALKVKNEVLVWMLLGLVSFLLGSVLG